MTEFIVVTGGVISGIGKGIVTASLGKLLSHHRKVFPVKCDGYLNVDPGTINPFEHGEVFVLDDGGEVDMDFGHYERFLNISCKSEWSLTTGKLFEYVIRKERQGKFLGSTVQIVPHFVQEIKQRWLDIAKKEQADVLLIEIGGVIGDMENPWFLEAARQLRRDVGDKHVTFVHLTFLPYLSSVGEQKTKPAQRDVEALRSRGILPDILIARSAAPCSLKTKQKLALFCTVDDEHIINLPDVKNVYEVPLVLQKEGLLAFLAKKHGIRQQKNLLSWKRLCNSQLMLKKQVRIVICGKYTTLKDSYASLIEALTHAGLAQKIEISLSFIDAVELEKGKLTPQQALAGKDGLIVPIGFGSRGVEGKIRMISFARKNKLPFLGLCMGMQLAVIEFARNVCKLASASSEEFGKTQHPVICYLPGQQEVNALGASMRLGLHLSLLKKDTMVQRIYNKRKCSERHRHRYEVNPTYHAMLENKGLTISGTGEDGQLAEFIELSSQQHPFFVATQAHPEYLSRPEMPHPLFSAFLSATHTYQKKNQQKKKQRMPKKVKPSG